MAPRAAARVVAEAAVAADGAEAGVAVGVGLRQRAWVKVCIRHGLRGWCSCTPPWKKIDR